MCLTPPLPGQSGAPQRYPGGMERQGAPDPSYPELCLHGMFQIGILKRSVSGERGFHAPTPTTVKTITIDPPPTTPPDPPLIGLTTSITPIIKTKLVRLSSVKANRNRPARLPCPALPCPARRPRPATRPAIRPARRPIRAYPPWFPAIFPSKDVENPSKDVKNPLVGGVFDDYSGSYEKNGRFCAQK